MGHPQRKRKAKREADIAGLWSLVLCQALFPGDPARVAEVQSGKPGRVHRLVGWEIYSTNVCHACYFTGTAGSFFTRDHTIVSGYQRFWNRTGQKEISRVKRARTRRRNRITRNK